MDTNATEGRNAADESDIVGSFDRSGSLSRYVIADTATDDAWLSIAKTEAPALGEWR